MCALQTALRFLEARCPGHVVKRSAFFEEAVSGVGLYEWSSASFAQAACVRPVYLEVIYFNPYILALRRFSLDVNLE